MQITAYREYGPALVDKLQVGFAVAVTDLVSRIGLLAIDRLGINSMCFSTRSSGWIVYGTTVNSVRAHANVEVTVEP